jgi:hypothetical protein
MSDANRLLFLRIALIVIGLTFIFGRTAWLGWQDSNRRIRPQAI